jgi:hypothetical protein
MALSLRFLLSPTHTPAPNMHAVLPYAHWWSHQRTNDGTFHTVHFPDAVPRLGGRFAFAEGDFLHMSPPEPASSSRRRRTRRWARTRAATSGSGSASAHHTKPATISPWTRPAAARRATTCS